MKQKKIKQKNKKNQKTVCLVCLEEKRLDEMEIRSRNPDGTCNRTNRCRKCKNAYEVLRIKKKKGYDVSDEEMQKWKIKTDISQLTGKAKEKRIEMEQRKLKTFRKAMEEYYSRLNKKKKVKNMTYQIEVDLLEKMQCIVKKSDFINMLIRNHFKG